MKIGWVWVAASACGPITVGEECPLELTELMSAGESWTLPGTDVRKDFIEIQNTSGDYTVDLGTYGMSLQVPGRDDHPQEFLSADPITLEPGERIFGLASTYAARDLEAAAPAGGARFTMVLDMNNDNASVELRRLDRREEWHLCEHVFVPDQHVGLSFSRQDDPADPWCIAAPTPGEPNAPCFADQDAPPP